MLKNGTFSGTTSCYKDFVNGYSVVEFLTDVKTAEESASSKDGNRIRILLPEALPADAGLPYIAVGAKIPSSTNSADFNVEYGTSGRKWTYNHQGGYAYGTENIAKNIWNIDVDTEHFGKETIKGIYLNPWGQQVVEIPAGVAVEIEYVGFFSSLDDAKNFVYVRDLPAVEEITSESFVYLDANDVKTATGKGEIITDEGLTVVHYTADQAKRGNKLTFHTEKTGKVTSTGEDSAFGYPYHVVRYKSTGIGSGAGGADGINFRGSGTDEQQWNNSRKPANHPTYDFETYYIYDWNGATSNTAISDTWTNPYLEWQAYGTDATAENGDIWFESYAMFKTKEQAEAYIELVKAEAITPDDVTLLVDGGEKNTFVAGEWGKLSAAAAPKRTDGLPVTYKTTVTLTDGTILKAKKQVEVRANVTPAKLIEAKDIYLGDLGTGTKTAYDAEKNLIVLTVNSDTNIGGESYAHLSLNTPARIDGYEDQIKYLKVGYEYGGTATSTNVRTTGGNFDVYMTIAAAKEAGITDNRFWGNNLDFSINGKSAVFDFSTMNSGPLAGYYSDNLTSGDTYDWARLKPFANGTAPAGATFGLKYLAFFDNLADAKAYTYIDPEKYTVTYMVNDLVYETMTVSEGKTLVYPETKPAFADKLFVRWDVAEGTEITEDMTVNAVFAAPLALYTGGDIQFTGGGATSSLQTSYENNIATATLPKFTGADGNRVDISTPGALKGDGAQYMAYGIKISNVDTNDADTTNRIAEESGKAQRRWSGTDVNQQYSTTEIKKHVIDFSTFNDWDKVQNTDKLLGISLNPWSNGSYTCPAGTVIEVQYIAFFDTLEAANAYVFEAPATHEVKFMAGGEVVDTVTVYDGNSLVYTAKQPINVPDGYAFAGWDTPEGTLVTGNMVVYAIFKPGAALDTEYVVYGRDITYSKPTNGWREGTQEVIGDTLKFRIGDTQGANWDNDANGSLTITISGLNFPKTHKYYAFGIGNDITTSENYATTHDNVTLGGVTADIDLKKAVGEGPVSIIGDFSSKTFTSDTITSITFDPVWRKDYQLHSGESGYRVGKGAEFNITYIAAFETKAEAEKFVEAFNATLVTTKVTVKATDGGKVNTAGGSYTQGELITFVATPDNGYVFDGWYDVTGTSSELSKNLSYVYTVGESEAILEARFTPQTTKTYAKLEYEGPKDTTVGSITVSSSQQQNGYVPNGVPVDMTATAGDDHNFGYWFRETTTTGQMVFIGLDENIQAYALGTGVLYNAEFFAKGAGKQTIYVDATGVILAKAGEDKPTPSQPGYTWNGQWKTKAESDAVLVLTPIYTRNESGSSALTVYAANGRSQTLNPAFNSQLTFDAGADNVVWTLNVGGKSYPVSYNRVFTFRYRLTSTPVTLTATVIDTAPQAIITGLEATNDGTAATFVGAYYLPEEATIKGYGVLLTDDAEVAETMTVTSDGIIVGNIAKSTDSNNAVFVVKKNNVGGATWYGKPFISYTVPDNEEGFVYYGDLMTAEA